MVQSVATARVKKKLKIDRRQERAERRREHIPDRAAGEAAL